MHLHYTIITTDTPTATIHNWHEAKSAIKKFGASFAAESLQCNARLKKSTCSTRAKYCNQFYANWKMQQSAIKLDSSTNAESHYEIGTLSHAHLLKFLWSAN